MRRHGSESLWAQINRVTKPVKPGFERFSDRALRQPWRYSATKHYSLRWIVAQCVVQEKVGPWVAYRMVRRWTILHGFWPKPHRRPGNRGYAKRPRLRKARVTSNPVLPEASDGA